MSIEVNNISKSYGAQKALDNISFAVQKGEIVGFLGPNGAGKSTLMKILTTYINADEGSAIVNGFEVNSNQIYIKARAKYRFYSPSITIMEIFLVEPDDLGLGGMKLNWNGFSGTHKIAEIRAFKNQSVEFQWFGFYDKEKKK